jgi:hypothetical protein
VVEIVGPEPRDNLPGAVDGQLVEHTTEIRAAFLAEKADVLHALHKALHKTFASGAVEIGRHLSEVKATFDRGDNPEFLAWVYQTLGWKKSSVYGFINIYELASTNKFSNGLENFDLSSLYLLAAPSTPAKVVEAIAERSGEGERLSRGEVKTLVAEAKAADRVRERNRAPAASKSTSKSNSNSNSIKTPTARDPNEILAGRMYDQYAGDKKYRPLPKMAAAFDAEPSEVREALKSLGGCVISRKTNGQTEYKIMRDTEADMLSALAAKDAKIAKLEARIAELEAEIEQLPAPAMATAPAMAMVS